jgi:hypothetical protein
MVLKKIVKIVYYFAAASLTAMLVLIGLVAFHFQPIDPRSSVGVAHLHRLAQTGQPLITDLEQYHKKHGCYPAQISDLYPNYYKTRRIPWYYGGWTIPQNAQQYDISILPGPGHDPLLQFHRNADGTGQWDYDPGDGSPETLLSFSTHP